MIFVTGGTGLIGSHLLYELASAGRQIKALKRSTADIRQVLHTFSYYSSEPEKLFERIEWVEGDITDYFGLEILLKDITEVYHCAGMISFNRTDRKMMNKVNVEGTANLVNAAIEGGVKKFCHVSSVAALGKLRNGEPVSEETNWTSAKKNSGYSSSKFFSETEVWRGMEEGLDAVIVNPSVVLGPGSWNEGSSKLFTTINDGMKFYTAGSTGFVDVRDVAQAMILLMEDEIFAKLKNQRFLLNAENIGYRQLFNQIADALGKPSPKYQATGFLLSIAWRAAWIKGVITRSASSITREAVSGSNRINNFDGSKISRRTGFQYRSISESVADAVRHLKNDQKRLVKE